MEFRLTYRGPLKAASASSGRAKEKQLLRQGFHKQLRELWRQHPELRRESQERYVIVTTPSNQASYPGPGVRQIMPEAMILGGHPEAKPWVQHIADSHAHFGFRFVPLISKAGGFTCALGILFLRRDNPGGLIDSGGDIDNRIKVLLDGLRMPKTIEECCGASPQVDEDPFYCLLQDDDLITGLSVTTDRLLVPVEDDEGDHDVHLIIRVTVENPLSIFAGGRLI